MTEKKLLRKNKRTTRKSFAGKLRKDALKKIHVQLCDSPLLKQSQRIACTLPIHEEVDLRPFIETLLIRGQECFLPVLTDDILLFSPYTSDTNLEKRDFSILEPTDEIKVDWHSLDAILMPLIAFDKSKNRIGYGRGHYDKTFALHPHHSPPPLIGVAFECQLTETIIPDSWDIPLDYIVTEDGWR
jgi:5-formyltetrahydrofolate cyclo-ligase